MNIYQFKGMMRNGEPRDGIFFGSHPREVAQFLKSCRIQPISIKKQSETLLMSVITLFDGHFITVIDGSMAA